MGFETHLLNGSIMLLAHAVILLAGAVRTWRRDFGTRKHVAQHQPLFVPRRLSRYAAF